MWHSMLTRLESLVLKDKAVGDRAQVPAAGASLSLYRQGATVKTPTSVPSGATNYPLLVYDSGGLIRGLSPGDPVQVDAGGAVLYVTDVISPTELRVTNPGQSTVNLVLGMRLFATGNPRPVLSATPLYPLVGTSTTVAGGDGYVGGYIDQPRFDYVVSGGGISATRVYPDARCGTRPSPAWLNAQDFPSLQDAINALPTGSGGTIFLPAGVYPVTTGLVINTNNITMRGEGPGRTTILKSSNTPFDVITVNRGPLKLYDLEIDGNADTGGPVGDCVVFRGPGFSQNVVLHCWLENVVFKRASQYGVRFLEGILTVLINCKFIDNRVSGVGIFEGSTTLRFTHCFFGSNDHAGAELAKCQNISFIGCVFDSNLGGQEIAEGNGIEMLDQSQAYILGCGFKRSVNGSASPPKQFIYGESARSPIVEGCWFDGGLVVADRPERAVRVLDTVGAQVSNNTVVNTTIEAFSFAGESKNCVEFGNRDFGVTGLPRISVSAGSTVLSLSKGAVELFSYPTVPSTTLGMTDGALIWVKSPPSLRILVSGIWREVDLDPF